MRGGKNHLPLLRKRTLATLAALLCMMALMPMTARAETINTVISSEELTKSSTVYVGEVVVDGVSEIKYLYSDDITLSSVLLQHLLDGLNGMADGDYAALLEEYKVNAYFYLPEERLALCSNPDLIAAMDENWSSALYVGTLYYADKLVMSEINANLYDLDEGFKAVLDAKIAQRIEDIDNPIDEPKCIVSHLGTDSHSNVYYTVENGQIIKHVDTYVTFNSEATTVIYTKVVLKTPMTETPLTFEAVEDGTIEVANPLELTFEYKLNDGEWTASNADLISISVVIDDVVQFRGDNDYTYSDDSYEGTRFTCTNDCYVYGNVMSLLSSTGFATAATMDVDYGLGYLFCADEYGGTTNTTIKNHPVKDIILPATTLGNFTYLFMFYGCEGLTRAPELPATTLGEYCYDGMFNGCTGLTTGPSTLPATTLAEGCYTFMFNGCTNLVTAPTLPATTLANMCYDGIFMDCTSLVNAPALPATTLVSGCYSEMFMGCTSLETAPVLPATTLEEYCYNMMFNGCTSLNTVTCLATDISAEGCTYGWLTNVAATGTFVKAAGTDWSEKVPTIDYWGDTQINGIPEGWTVESIDVFTNDGNWDVAANWSGNAVPADGSDVAIVANATIPSGTTVNADNIDVYGSLTIADGGQLYHNNEGVTATVQKTISAYTPGTRDGWHLIGYSFADNGAAEEMDNLMANTYDLYYYDEPTHYWMNQKDANNNFTELEAAKGYLYANSQTQTIGLKGTLETANATVNLPLAYTEAAENLKGFNLVGNPFAHNVTTFAGANVASEVYRMNETMDNLMVSGISAADPLLPGEGFFVKATADNASITFNAQTRGESKATELVEVPTLTIDLLQDGLTIDRLVVKHEGEPLEKFTLRENGTRIYATEGGKDYAVVTVISSDSEANQTEIPVNFKAAKNGTYTISVNLENTDFGYLHLIDNLTGTDVDLLAPVIARNEAIQGTASYTFHAKTTDYASRFRLVFSVCGDANSDNEPFAYVDTAGNIIVNGGSSTGLETLQVVDVMGRVIVQGDAMNRVSTSGMTPGIYVLRLINGNDVRTQKIVVR